MIRILSNYGSISLIMVKYISNFQKIQFLRTIFTNCTESQYSKHRKYKCKSYKENMLQEIENLHENNPKLYRQLINELQGKHYDQE